MLTGTLGRDEPAFDGLCKRVARRLPPSVARLEVEQAQRHPAGARPQHPGALGEAPRSAAVAAAQCLVEQTAQAEKFGLGPGEHRGKVFFCRRLVAVELRTIDAETARRHYAEHADKPFFADLVAFITRSPSLLVVVDGPEDTWKVVRTLMGVTNPKEAAPGPIRGDLGLLTTENLVHGSDGPDSAEREIGIVCPGLAA